MIDAFGNGHAHLWVGRPQHQTRGPAVFTHLIVDCALWMKGMCIVPAVLLFIMTFHICDSNFLRGKCRGSLGSW